MIRRILFIALASTALAFTACDDGHDHDHEAHGDPIEEAIEHGCEHVTGGPAEAVTAAADAASAPLGWEEHHRMDVTLLDDTAGAFHGHVHLDVDAAGEIVVMLMQNVTIELKSADGTVLTPEETHENHASCTGAAVNHVFDVEVGRYEMYISGAPSADVSYVIAEAGAHSEGEAHNH